jgi:hypothetical protein
MKKLPPGMSKLEEFETGKPQTEKLGFLKKKLGYNLLFFFLSSVFIIPLITEGLSQMPDYFYPLQ